MSNKVAVYEAVKQGHATYAEIVAATDVHPGSVGPVLTDLVRGGSLRRITPRQYRHAFPRSRLPDVYEVADG